MTEPVTRDLVDRTELRRILVEAGDPSHTPKWRSALRHAIGRLDAMPSVECPRGWTRDEVLHELDTHPGAVCEWLNPFTTGEWVTYYLNVEGWHPEVRRYDVRVVLPEPNPQLGDEEWTAPNLATECESARPTVTVDAANLRALLTYDGDNDFGAAGEMLRRELLDACSAVIVPEPVTVWVPLTKLVGRTLPGETKPVEWIRWACGEWRWGTVRVFAPTNNNTMPLPVDLETGMVEVLAEGDA